MDNTIANQQKRQQVILQRIEQQLNVLEEPTTALLSNIDLKSMTPHQRVQAACRLLKLISHLTELHESCVLSDDNYRLQVFRNLILSAINEGEVSMLQDNI